MAASTSGTTCPTTGRYTTMRDSTLPPGRTYFELSKNEWGYGVQADELDVVPRPLTNAERFRVTAFTFTDAAGDRWSRDHQGRLSATSGKESEATD
ncbi:hypothetical protein [Micrococcus luteus]|uniref:hypothetical protein n=1 Tax=Micrococcus luteus TaxID=1270 RepID=UPI0012DFB076|nr:hypothetical protein [Micrococcus luteus]QGS22010.1 hypothetical protein FOB85_07550 [Micrococcus luteus]QHG59114.1 hypothetical protein FOF50_00185 [Micrococcus luteus]